MVRPNVGGLSGIQTNADFQFQGGKSGFFQRLMVGYLQILVLIWRVSKEQFQ